MAILLHAAVFALGFALFAVTLTSAVKTFVLPRSATDGLTRAVFLVMRRAFDLRLRVRPRTLSAIGSWLSTRR